MVKYKVIVEHLQNSEFLEYDAYGVCAYIEESGTVVASFSDVFLEKEKAQELAELCNINELDPIHLRDVVDDMIVWSIRPAGLHRLHGGKQIYQWKQITLLWYSITTDFDNQYLF